MARPVSAPILQTTPLDHIQLGVSLANLPRTDGGVISVTDVTHGMVKNLPRDKVPAGSGRVVKNARIREDWVGIRPGTDEVGTKPDSTKVIGLFHIIHESGEVNLLRVTQSAFHIWDGASWIALSVTGGFKGTAQRVSATQMFGKVYLAFGISDGIWEVDFAAATVARVDEAPSAKFVYTFGERICAANVTEKSGGAFPNKVMWSGNSLPQDWDGDTSGEEDLIAEELGNPITGAVAMEREAVLIRHHSIVHQTRQPFAQAPFRFDTIIKGIGSDLPYTTVLTPLGVIFADRRTSNVYLYRPGSFPVSIASHSPGGGPSEIHELLFEDLAAAVHSVATYDPEEGEYYLGLVWTTDNDLITRRWVCNLHRGFPAWSYDDSPTVSALGVVLFPPATTTIDDLSGTINAQTGTIDALSSRSPAVPTLVAGISTGEVISFSYDHTDDWNDTIGEFEFQSPNIGDPVHRTTIKDLEVTCDIPNTGSVTVEQSRDESTWTNTKTESRTGASARQKVRLPKTQLTGDDLYWRIQTVANEFKIYSWWARLMQKGVQQGGQQ